MSWGQYSLHFPLEAPVVFVDIETTGLSSSTDEIIEIAAIAVRPGQSRHKAIECLVRPRRPIPQHITSLTGITQEMVEENGFTLDDALGHFLDLVSDMPIVAYNVSFDAGFLQNHCAGHVKLRTPVGHACALKLARLAWPRLRNHKLSSVSAHLGLVGDGRHRALADVKRCLQIYYRAIGVTTTEPTEFR